MMINPVVARRLVWLGVIVGGLSILFMVLNPVVQKMLSVGRQAATASRLRQIGVAIQSYHDDYGSFPPAVVLGPDGVPWHSWRVLLLPYLDHKELADEYRMDEPWDSPANRLLVDRCPEVFQLPTSEVRSGCTNASVIVGRRTAWPAHYPMSAREFERGVSNTAFITEVPATREWTDPRDMTARQFLKLFYSKAESGDRAVLFGNGTVKNLTQEIDRKILLSFLTPRGPNVTFRGDNWPTMFAESKSRAHGEIVSSSLLEHSTFHASWDEPLGDNQNELWCAVFQLAWDNLRARTSGELLTAEKSAMVDRLNNSRFDQTCLDEGSYSLFERPADAAATEQLRANIQTVFPDVDPALTEINDSAAIRLYGILKKSIVFPAELCPMKPLKFQAEDRDTLVESFGNQSLDSSQKRLAFEDTVHVGDYVSDEDFILVLKTEGDREDEILLAMIEPELTLNECWRIVEQRLKSPHEHRVAETLRSRELLQIPIIDLNIEHQFTELENQVVTNIPVEPPSTITVAREAIRFRLDEVGADLLSQVEIVRVLGDFGGGGGAAFDPMKPRRFVFDQPFLLALREKSASQPYLLCWVAHPDNMVPSEAESAASQ
ncbi:MAG: DUF1559 family PulG-like putative transporter [Planctomycetales bacterium]|jgi:hypothetical protein